MIYIYIYISFFCIEKTYTKLRKYYWQLGAGSDYGMKKVIDVLLYITAFMLHTLDAVMIHGNSNN